MLLSPVPEGVELPASIKVGCCTTWGIKESLEHPGQVMAWVETRCEGEYDELATTTPVDQLAEYAAMLDDAFGTQFMAATRNDPENLPKRRGRNTLDIDAILDEDLGD